MHGGKFYASRDQQTRASAIRSHDRCSLRRSAKGGGGTDIRRFHLRESVSRADREFAEQIAEAPAPFGAMRAMRWPSGIRNPPSFRNPLALAMTRSAQRPSRRLGNW